MGEYIDFITKVHKKTNRNYMERVVNYNKAECAKIAKEFGKDFWDGNREHGYGGYNYDGRWKVVAEEIKNHYNLKPGQKVLDVGCGKGFLLYELTKLVPGVNVVGLDISEYAINNSKSEVRGYLEVGKAENLPYENNSFDLVISINTLHNLHVYNLKKAIQDIERVSKENSYILVESYRNEEEKVNLLYWQLTCECFYSPEEWKWLYNEWNYTGDYSFIYFE